MNIYHFSLHIIGRSKGRSIVAASAYRSGEKLYEIETGRYRAYRIKEDIVYTDIILPKNAPAEYADRAILWNSVQKIEKNKNARLAKELDVALPITENVETHKAIMKEYGQYLADQGMCVDLAIHKTKNNPHGHFLLTVRSIGEDGQWLPKAKKVNILDEAGNRIPLLDEDGKQKKDRQGRKQWKSKDCRITDWGDRNTLLKWRIKWAEVCNQYLAPENRIDHRSNKERGLDEIPTIHLGAAATALERKGIATELGAKNKEIKEINAYIKSVNDELKADAQAIMDIKDKIREEQDEVARM